MKRKAVEDDRKEEEEETTLEGRPELKGDPALKVAQLHAYIRRLDTGISKARETAERARKLAEKYRSTATTSVEYYRDGQLVDSEMAVNRTRVNRAEFQDRRATREEEKISRAEQLIADARIQITELEGLIKD